MPLTAEPLTRARLPNRGVQSAVIYWIRYLYSAFGAESFLARATARQPTGLLWQRGPAEDGNGAITHDALLASISPSVEMSSRSTGRKAKIRREMAERLKARLYGDTELTSRLMADDDIQTDISGHVQDKPT